MMHLPSPVRAVSLVWAIASGLTACAPPSSTIRPTVPPQPVAVVNDTDAPHTALLAVGFEPSGESRVPPRGCVQLDPPPGRAGELRVQAIDADQNVVVDLHGEQLAAALAPCTCSAGRFDRCVHIPPRQ